MNTTNSPNLLHLIRRIGIFVQDFWVALVSGCFLLGVLFFWLYLNNYKWTGLSSFIQIETIVLIIIGAISTHNYSLSIIKLTEITDGETIWQQVLVTVCNVGFFTFAIFHLRHPTWHIFGIILIYAGFSINNVLEIKALFSSALVNHVTAQRQRIVDRNIWLRNENVPAIIGFTIIAITLSGLILLEYPDSQGEQVIKSLKAFAAGAATLHLSLSVLKYFKC